MARYKNGTIMRRVPLPICANCPPSKNTCSTGRRVAVKNASPRSAPMDDATTSASQAVLARAGKAGQQGLQLGAAAHAPDEFGMTTLDGFFFHMLYDRRGHNFHKHGGLPKHFAITAKICCTSVWVRYIVSSSMITSAGAFFSAISPRQSSIADWAI